jgi:hypothetical protein
MISKVDQTHKWASIYLLYKRYRIKYDATKRFLRNESSFSSTTHGVSPEELTEGLTEHEIKFLNIDTLHAESSSDRIKLPLMTGRFIYEDVSMKLLSLIESDVDRKYINHTVVVGGVSGHTILLLELELILNVNWIPIMFACIITQVPHHHSIREIVDALEDMGLVSIEQRKTFSYISIITSLAEKMNVYL